MPFFITKLIYDLFITDTIALILLLSLLLVLLLLVNLISNDYYDSSLFYSVITIA